MTRRNEIMRNFDAQHSYMEDMVQTGIENNRKRYGFLTVKCADGTQLEDVQIHAEQLTHEFRFGANLFMLDQMETPEKNTLYKERFADLFNMATLPFYWNTLEPERGKPRYDADSAPIYRRPPIDACVNFCEENGIEPREHALAYEHFFPEWLWGESTCVVKRELERRFSEIAERYAARIPTIEVANEMFWKEGRTSFYREPDYLLWCYKMAEKYFPHNKLSINEGENIFCDHTRSVAPYYAYIENTILKGGRIDLIGMQFHTWTRRENFASNAEFFYNPRNIYTVLDTYAGLRRALEITEITIPAFSEERENELLQAEILTNLYKIWFSHPSMEHIIYWNLVDGYAYLAEPGDMTAGENYYYGGLLRFDHTPKPAYEALHHLIHKEWHTDVTVDAPGGSAYFKGFCGRYRLTVRAGGKECIREVELRKNGDNRFEITL